MKQIWIIVTRLKLWVAVVRHNFYYCIPSSFYCLLCRRSIIVWQAVWVLIIELVIHSIFLSCLLYSGGGGGGRLWLLGILYNKFTKKRCGCFDHLRNPEELERNGFVFDDSLQLVHQPGLLGITLQFPVHPRLPDPGQLQLQLPLLPQDLIPETRGRLHKLQLTPSALQHSKCIRSNLLSKNV